MYMYTNTIMYSYIYIYIYQANGLSGLVPCDVEGGGVMLKVPFALLDASDLTIQEIFV